MELLGGWFLVDLRVLVFESGMVLSFCTHSWKLVRHRIIQGTDRYVHVSIEALISGKLFDWLLLHIDLWSFNSFTLRTLARRAKCILVGYEFWILLDLV